MTQKEEDKVGFIIIESFPHWNDLYANEASVGSHSIVRQKYSIMILKNICAL